MAAALVEARPYNNASQHSMSASFTGLPDELPIEICRFLAGDPAANERPVFTFSERNTSVIVLNLAPRDISALSQVSRNLQAVVARYLLGSGRYLFDFNRRIHMPLIAHLTDGNSIPSQRLNEYLLSATNHRPEIFHQIHKDRKLRSLLLSANQDDHIAVRLAAICGRPDMFNLFLDASSFFHINNHIRVVDLSHLVCEYLGLDLRPTGLVEQDEMATNR